MYITFEKSQVYLLTSFMVMCFISAYGITDTHSLLSPVPLSLSPSQEKLAFVTIVKIDDRIAETINIINVDGSNLQQIPVASGLVDGCLSWSFDSNRIAFSIVDNKAKTVAITAVDVQTLIKKEITTGKGDFSPKWSPNNLNIIYFIKMTQAGPTDKNELTNQSSVSNLWLVDVNNTQETQLTTINNVYALSWDITEDGKRCYYLATKGDTTEIWTTNLQTMHTQKLYNLKGKGARFISCSSSGEDILFFWQDLLQFFWLDLLQGDLWLLKADGSDKKKLSNKHCALMPIWMADRQIVTVDEKGSIWQLNISDNQYKKLASKVTGRQPTWDPKQQRLFFVKKSKEIWLMDRDGSNSRQIYTTDSN